MDRRKLIKTTIGALFGVSAIPAALEKPVSSIVMPMHLIPMLDAVGRQKFMYDYVFRMGGREEADRYCPHHIS